jgi:hypothetical protein
LFENQLLSPERLIANHSALNRVERCLPTLKVAVVAEFNVISFLIHSKLSKRTEIRNPAKRLLRLTVCCGVGVRFRRTFSVSSFYYQAIKFHLS